MISKVGYSFRKDLLVGVFKKGDESLTVWYDDHYYASKYIKGIFDTEKELVDALTDIGFKLFKRMNF